MKQVYFCPNFDFLPTNIWDCPFSNGMERTSEMQPGEYFNEILAVTLGRDDDHGNLYLMVGYSFNIYDY